MQGGSESLGLGLRARLSRKPGRIKLLAAIAAVPLLTQGINQAKGATLYWDTNGTTPGAGTANGVWNTSSNWTTDSTGSIAAGTWVTSSDAVFSAGTDATGSFTINPSGAVSANTITVNTGTVKQTSGSPVTIGALANTPGVTINNGAQYSEAASTELVATNAAQLVLNGGTFTETVQGAAANGFLNTNFKIVLGPLGGTLNLPTAAAAGGAGINNFVAYTSTNPITTSSGTGGLTFQGNSTALRVATANTYAGPTTIKSTGAAGTFFELRQNTTANMLPTGTDLNIMSGGVFNLNTVSAQVNSLTGAAGSFVAFAGGSSVLTVSGTTSSAFNGIIEDSFTNFGAAAGTAGRLTKAGSSTLTLGGLNNFTGGVTLTAGGITVSSGGSLCNSDVAVNGGTLTLNNTTQNIKTLSGTGGTVSLGTGNTLISNAGISATYAGTVTGAGGYTYNGSGFTGTLTGTLNYTGATGVTAGTLQATHALPTATTLNVNGGTFNLNGISSTVAGVSLQSGSISGAGTLTSTSAFDIQGGTASSILGGAVAMNKTAAGTATLTAANTYSGNTTISGGKLLVNNSSGSGTGGGNVFVNNSGTLGGSGSISGAVTVNSGGHVAAGLGTGSGATLTASSLDLKDGSLMDFTLGSPGVADNLNVTADNGMNIEGGATGTLVNITAAAGGTFHLISYNNTAGHTFAGSISDLHVGTLSGADSATFSLNPSNHSIDVNVLLADRVWNHDGDESWNNDSNWTSPTQPNGMGQIAEFLGAATSDVTVSIDGSDKTVGSIHFDNTHTYTLLTDGTHKLVMSSGPINATINVTNGSHLIGTPVQLNNTTDVTVTHAADQVQFEAYPITGTGGMNVLGAGTVDIDTTYSASGAINNAGPGTLIIDASGNIAAGGLTQSGTGSTTCTGLISGSSNVTVSGGSLKMVSGNTFTGKNFLNGGTLYISNDANLGAIPASTVADQISFNGGTLTLTAAVGINSKRGITVGANGGTLNIANAGDTITMNSVINNAAGRFTKAGPGTMTFGTGVNMTGSATSSVGITGGTLSFDTATHFGAQQKIVLDGGNLEYTPTGNGVTFLSGINLEIGPSGSGTIITHDNPDHTTAQSAIFQSAVINGSGGTLIKAGDGEFRSSSSGPNTFSKLQVLGGFYRVSVATTGTVDTQLGAVPNSYVQDAIDLNGTGPTRSTGGVAIGTSATIVTPSARGIKIESNGATFGTNASWTINSIISGPGSLSVNENGWAPTSSTGNHTGGNFLSLAGANNYGGATNINNAILEASGGGAIPDGSAVTILSATSVATPANGGPNDQAVLRIINGDETIGSLAGGGGTAATGNPCYGFVVLGTGGSLTTGADGSSTAFSGQITGAGNVTKVGAGTWTINGFDLANTGATNINGGVLQFGNSAAGLNDGSTVTIAAAGTLDMNGFLDSIGALAGDGPIINGANLIIKGSNASPVTYNGNYSGSGTLRKSGAGTQLLTGSNSFGTVTIDGGILAVNSSNALGNSGTNDLVFATGGTLRTDANLNTGRNVTLNSGGGIIDSNGSDDVLSGAISGAGSLTKQGAGTLALTNSNTYSGVTNINAGTLIVTSSANLGDESATNNITFNGGTLRTDSADLVTSRTVTLNAGGGTVNSNGNNVTLSGVVSGVGSLTKTGAGVLQATNTNTYSGATNVYGGEVRATTSSNLGDASATNGIGLDSSGQLTLLGAVNSPLRNIAVASGNGTIDVGSGNDSTFGNVNGTGTLTKSNGGNLTVNYVRTGGLNVNGGKVTIAHSGGANASTSVITSLSVPSQLDVTDNKLIVKAANQLSAVTALVQSGRNQDGFGIPQWNGNGIITSESNAGASLATSIGVVSEADLVAAGQGKASFGTQPLTGNETLAMYTWDGDANLDGKVNADDYFQIDSHYGKASNGWFTGDFNYDGSVTGDDYMYIDAGYGAQAGVVIPTAPALGGGVSAVPEPATLGLLGMSALMLGRRRRRKN